MKSNQKTEIYRLLILNKIDLDQSEQIVEKITGNRTRRIPELTAYETAKMLKYLSAQK